MRRQRKRQEGKRRRKIPTTGAKHRNWSTPSETKKMGGKMRDKKEKTHGKDKQQQEQITELVDFERNKKMKGQARDNNEETDKKDTNRSKTLNWSTRKRKRKGGSRSSLCGPVAWTRNN